MLTPFEPLTAQVANTDSPSPRSIVTLRVILGLSFAAAILISWPMWISSREFPLVPVLSFIPPLPAPFDLVPPALLLVSIAVTLFIPSRIAAISVISITLALWAQDQNRIHPWSFVFLLFYGALASQSSSRTRDNLIPALQFILIAVYFWTGFQKLRVSYFHGTTPLIATTLIGGTPSHLVDTIFYLVPFLEIVSAILLATCRFRKVGTLMVVFLHAAIVSVLLIGGVNYSVIPWNIFMAGAAILLFWRGKTPARTILSPGPSLPVGIIQVLCGILPALGYLGLWNLYLSFAVYAGASGAGYAFINDSRDALPKTIPFYSSNPENQKIKEVGLDAWGYKVLRSMPSPEPRVLRAIGSRLCLDYFSSGKEMIIFFTDPMLPWETTKPEHAYVCENGVLVPVAPTS